MEIFLKETFLRVFIYYPDLIVHLAVLENKEKPCSIASGLFSPHKKRMRLLGLFTWPWKEELTLKNTPVRGRAQKPRRKVLCTPEKSCIDDYLFCRKSSTFIRFFIRVKKYNNKIGKKSKNIKNSPPYTFIWPYTVIREC